MTAATLPAPRRAPISPEHRAFGAETRAVEEGHRAFVQPDGSIRVVSDTQPGVAYRVTFAAHGDGVVWFGCSCPSGSFRAGAAPVVCKHSALVGRRLERERLARWEGGLWRSALPVVAPVPVDEAAVFAGLPA